jgi:hypothetical protein
MLGFQINRFPHGVRCIFDNQAIRGDQNTFALDTNWRYQDRFRTWPNFDLRMRDVNFSVLNM